MGIRTCKRLKIEQNTGLRHETNGLEAGVPQKSRPCAGLDGPGACTLTYTLPKKRGRSLVTFLLPERRSRSSHSSDGADPEAELLKLRSPDGLSRAATPGELSLSTPLKTPSPPIVLELLLLHHLSHCTYRCRKQAGLLTCTHACLASPRLESELHEHRTAAVLFFTESLFPSVLGGTESKLDECH